jgi:3-oxoacyl-[acyl-carrier-protein] synthase-3
LLVRRVLRVENCRSQTKTLLYARSGGISGERVVGPDQASVRICAARIGVEPAWITKRTGISARRRTLDGEGLSDLAIEAGQRALDAAGLSASYVDAVLVATSSADDVVPQAAPIVAGALGADRAMAWDVGLACTGFLAGLQQGAALIESGRANTVLLIGGGAAHRRHRVPRHGAARAPARAQR